MELKSWTKWTQSLWTFIPLGQNTDKENDITSKTGKMVVVHVLGSAGPENDTNDMEK